MNNYFIFIALVLIMKLCYTQAYFAPRKFASTSFQRLSLSTLKRGSGVSRWSLKGASSSSSSGSIPFIPILVSIEGNIGAGKTTLLRQLRNNHPEWHSIDEPVETWSKIKNDQGKSILEVFYEDRKRWSYTFQNCALLTRFENIEKKIQSVQRSSGDEGIHIFLTERCLDTDYHVFTRMLLEEGSITSMEIELYERLLRHLRQTSTPLSAIIHVNSPPALCQERIKIRGRNGEEAITFDYLNKLNKYQSKWIESAKIPTLSTENTNYVEVEKFIMELKTRAEKGIDDVHHSSDELTQLSFESIFNLNESSSSSSSSSQKSTEFDNGSKLTKQQIKFI